MWLAVPQVPHSSFISEWNATIAVGSDGRVPLLWPIVTRAAGYCWSQDGHICELNKSVSFHLFFIFFILSFIRRELALWQDPIPALPTQVAMATWPEQDYRCQFPDCVRRWRRSLRTTDLSFVGRFIDIEPTIPRADQENAAILWDRLPTSASSVDRKLHAMPCIPEWPALAHRIDGGCGSDPSFSKKKIKKNKKK